MLRSTKTKIKTAMVLMFTIARVGIPLVTEADSMSSTNYKVQSDVMSIGGGRSTSTNYIVEDTLGELATGEGLTSTNYSACAGFQCAGEAAIPYLTFDIDASVTDGENSAPYSVALGVVPTGSVRVSGSTDSVKMVVLEADTNAASGVIVTVRNANGTNGLASTSVPADDIDSSDGSMVAGTENYGLCVYTAGLSGFSRAAPYNSGTCATNTETNAIQGLTSSGENIVSTAGAVTGAHAEIAVQAAIHTTTAAHADYADTLTFIATATY